MWGRMKCRASTILSRVGEQSKGLYVIKVVEEFLGLGTPPSSFYGTIKCRLIKFPGVDESQPHALMTSIGFFYEAGISQYLMIDECIDF